MQDHDASYRLLFSNPALVRALFQGIIEAPWRDQVDWDGIELLSADYVSDTLAQRRGDIVWRLPRLGGYDVLLLLMIEHQSTIDFYMALRILTYMGLLYQALLAQKRIKPGQPLPPVLPIVLYSGVRPWNAARDVSGLISVFPQSLRRYLPRLQYLLLDERALVEAGKLPEANLASLLFRMEHNRGLHDMETLIQKVYNYTQADPAMRRAFTAWINRVLLPRALPEIQTPEAEDLLEIKTMLTENSRSWTHQWKMEGIAEGRKEGREEGLKEGQAAMLHSQLSLKFGPLPESVQQRLKNADSDTLQAWALALLQANSLDDLFGRH